MRFAASKSFVKVIDRGWADIQKLTRQMKDRGLYVKAGVVGAQATQPHDDTPGALTNAELAVIHEFGTRDGRIPERSFIRSSAAKHRPQYVALLARGVKAVLSGRTSYRTVLTLIGEKMASDMRNGIREGIPPPNAPSTLARKLAMTRPGSTGSPKPLIDTGRLLGSITYEVSR